MPQPISMPRSSWSSSSSSRTSSPPPSTLALSFGGRTARRRCRTSVERVAQYLSLSFSWPEKRFSWPILFASAFSPSSSRRRRISSQTRRLASSLCRIGISLQRFFIASVAASVVQTSISSRRRHRRISLASSPGATLAKQKLSTLLLRGGRSRWRTLFLLLLSCLASFGSWRRRRASFSSSLLIGRRRSGFRPFFAFRWRQFGVCRIIRKWWT